MRKNQLVFITFFSISFFMCLLILISSNQCFAKISFGKSKEKEVKILPTCSQTGEMQCPKGLKPTCPKQYKSSCVFVGTMQLPACLADTYDTTAFSYHLDKISCEKGN